MKITKAQAGYTFHPDVPDYTCGGCTFEKDFKGKDYCAYFGPSAPINEQIGSCNYWAHGEPEIQKLEIPWLSIFTKQQLGYDENRPGFGCRRCANFILGKNDCTRVDRGSPGDTPGEISPNACCSVWVRDPKRGGLSNAALVPLVQIKTAPRGPSRQSLAQMKKQ